MKVLILSPQPFFVERGTPINIRQICTSLSSAGHEVTLLSYPLGNDIGIKNVEIKRSPRVPFITSIKPGPSLKKIILDFFFFFSALKLVLTKKFDVYHGVEEAGFIAGFLSLFNKKPFVFDVDSSMSSQLQESGFIKLSFIINLFKSFESFFFKRASKVLTVCSALSNEVLKLCPDAKIHQIEDFPIEKLCTDLTSSEYCFREKHNIEKKIILYAGNFEPYQGVELLIESYAQTSNELKEQSHLVLVGSQNPKIKNLVTGLELEDKVTFTGHVQSSFMPSIHSQAEVLISPRLKGVNTPLKIYTYMDSQRLIIATDIHSHTQVLSEKSAILTKVDRKEFSKALELAFKKDHSDKIKEAKYLVDTKYSVARFNKEIISLYRELEVSLA